jgi:hypothetical protein
MARRLLLWAVAALIIAVAAPAMAGPADWQAAAAKGAALLGGASPPAVDVAAALAAGPDDANYWLAVGLTVKSGADVDYWLPVLVNGQNADGSWGAGALATAGAVIGLDAANAAAYASQIAAGADWLAAKQIADGSWAGGAADAYVVQALKAALAGAGAEDAVPPLVAVLAPLNAACINGTVDLDIKGQATDSGADKVVSLQLRWDGAAVGADFTWAAPGIADTGVCTRTVLAAALNNGSYVAAAVATDNTPLVSIASANVSVDKIVPDIATLTSFTSRSITVPATQTYLYGAPTGSPLKAVAAFNGQGRDPLGGCGLCSMTFLGTKNQVGLVRPALPLGLSMTIPQALFDGFPRWQEAEAFWSVLATIPTADVAMGSQSKPTAAGTTGNYTLAGYEVQVPSTGANTAVGLVWPSRVPAMAQVLGGLGMGIGNYTYGLTFVNAAGEGPVGQTGVIQTSAAIGGLGLPLVQAVNLTDIPTGPAGTTARNLYRTAAGGAVLKLVTTIPDNTTTSYVDTVADAALGGPLGTIVPPLSTQIGPLVDIDNSLNLAVKWLEWVNPLYPGGTGVPPGMFAELTAVPKTSFCLAVANPATDPRFETRSWGASPVPAAPAGTTTAVATGPAAPTLTLAPGLGLNIGDYYYVVSLVNASAVEGWAGTVAKITTTAGNQRVQLTGIAKGPTGTTARKIYRTAVAGGALKLVTTIANDVNPDLTITTYLDSLTDAILAGRASPPLGAIAPGLGLAGVPGNVNVGAHSYAVSFVTAAGGEGPCGGTSSITTTAGNQQVNVTDIAIGPAGTTARKIYRTKAGSGDLLYLTTLAGNVLTTLAAADNAPDVALGVDGTVPGLNPVINPVAGNLGVGDYYYAVTWSTGLPSGGKELWATPVSAKVTTVAGQQRMTVNLPAGMMALAPPGFLMRNIYRTKVGEGDLKFLVQIPNPATNVYNDNKADSALLYKGSLVKAVGVGANLSVGTYQYKVAYETAGMPENPALWPPLSTQLSIAYGGAWTLPSWSISPMGTASATVTTTAGNQSVHLIGISTIALGPPYTGWVSRRIYRTKAGGTDFFLLDTIADNTTATFEDNTKDGSLDDPEIPGVFFKDLNPRNMVIMGAGCELYPVLTTLPRYWPSRGRYAVNLKAKATDCATLATTSGATAVQLAEPIFEDVPVSFWAWDNIERIRAFKPAPRGIAVTLGTAAFPDSALPLKRFYAPGTPVKRWQMALFIVRAMGLVTDGVYETQRFVDVWPGWNGSTDDDEYYFTAMNALFALGISVGCRVDGANRYFCPNGNVTRAEMVTFLLRAFGQVPVSPLPSPPTFVDIAGHWAQGMIERAYIYDAPGDGVRITEGCLSIPPSTLYFCPNDWCTRDQMAVFLTRAWAMPAVPLGPSDPW